MISSCVLLPGTFLSPISTYVFVLVRAVRVTRKSGCNLLTGTIMSDKKNINNDNTTHNMVLRGDYKSCVIIL